MKSERWIAAELDQIRKIHQFRSINVQSAAGGIIPVGGDILINFSSNDYLDFIRRPELNVAAREAMERYGAGSGSSRLVTGTLEIHRQLETALSHHKGYAQTLLFGSGFLANLGVITALVDRSCMVAADRLVHASILDAIKLSGAKLVRFQHNDMDHLKSCLARSGKFERTLVITESIFSMDGDEAPIKDISDIACKHGAMVMIDEAHATGIFGPYGRGLIALHDLQSRVNVSMCTMSKGLGSYGGAVACSEPLRNWLINKARSLIYTTALPPAICAASLAGLRILENEPGLGGELLRKAALFREALREEGFNTGMSSSQIIPVFVGENDMALKLSDILRKQGIIATAIRPPTVPAGSARLRFSVTLAHDDGMLKRAAETLSRCADDIGFNRG